MLAILNIALIPFMNWLGWTGPIVDFKDFVLRIVLALAGVLVSFSAYHNTLGQSKDNIAWNKAVAEQELCLEDTIEARG
jgi:hypothetical protein